MEGRLSSACSLYALQGTEEQKATAVEMARQGLPCPASIAEQAQELGVIKSGQQTAATSSSTSVLKRAEQLVWWALARLILSIAVGTVLMLALRGALRYPPMPVSRAAWLQLIAPAAVTLVALIIFW
jgi:hypothetical protein